MKSSEAEILPILGTGMGGGFYAGRVHIDGQLYALIVAPKAEGEHKPIKMFNDSNDVPAAASWNDGLSNTNALAEAGSKLCQWIRGLRIGGFDDWYLPSLDELEVLYRNLKPTTEENYVYNRSGLNVSAAVPTLPYKLQDPAQTQAEVFMKGGTEAFDAAWYWSSTKHASDSDFAWYQYFDNGRQDYYTIDTSFRARVVRRLPI